MEQPRVKKPLVSVIIPNWNGKHLLGDCLDSLVSQSFTDFEIIVVDNASHDGSPDFIRSHYPGVIVIRMKTNTGFAGGCNAGIRASAGEYIALLNNDTRTDGDWLTHLVKAAQANPGTGMWASKILSFDNPELIDNVGLLLYRDGLARGRGRLESDHGQYDQQEETLIPSGCAGFYRRKMLDDIGLLDEDFFAYADDVDLGLRGRLAGWDCIYVPAAKVYHRYSSSSSTYSPLKAFLVERNRIWVLLKYYPAELILASCFFTLKRLLLQAYGAMSGRGATGKFTTEQGLSSAAVILLKAWWSALASLFKILKHRRELAPLRRVRRRDIHRLFSKYSISAQEIALKD